MTAGDVVRFGARQPNGGEDMTKQREPVFQDDAVTVYHGDCFDILPTLPTGSVSAVVTDPPYGLDFMHKAWDSFDRSPRKVKGTGGTQAPFGNHGVRPDTTQSATFQVWCEQWARECLRLADAGRSLGGVRRAHVPGIG